MLITYNNKIIGKLYRNMQVVKGILYNLNKVYPNVDQSPAPVITVDIIETDITTYQGNATRVYVLDEDLWYMRTHNGDYREYGIIATGKPQDPYIGELCLDDGHEWEYTSSGWSDLGETTSIIITSPDYLARNASNKGWIDLGFVYDAQTKVQMKVYPRYGSGKFWLGDAYVPDDQHDNRFFGVNTTSWYFDTEAARCNGSIAASTFPIEIELAPQYIKRLSTGTNIASTSAPATIDRHDYHYQWGMSSSVSYMGTDASTEYIDLYWLKVYKNNELVKDFYPLLKNGRYGLYEAINNEEIYPQDGNVTASTNTTELEFGGQPPQDYTPIPAPIPIETVYITAEDEYLKVNDNYYCKDYEYDVYEGGAKEATGNYRQGSQLTPTYIQGSIDDFTVYEGNKYYKNYIYVTPVSTQLSTGDWVRGDYIGMADIIASGTTKASSNFNVTVNGATRTAFIDGTAGSNLYYFKVYDDGNPITSLENFAANNRNIVSCNFSQIVHNQTCMFSFAFAYCTSLTGAPELPATTLERDCYKQMFRDCKALTSAPSLPATTLASACYSDMFNHCTALTSAPSLPATTLASYCYAGMFDGCTSLTSAPSLPAETLASYCYKYMFNGCRNLTTAPSLPAETLAQYCYYGMFNSCTSLTTAPSLPATTLANYCYQQMFAGCTNLTTAPSLPAETLANYCYSNMFNCCTSLTSAPALPAETLAPYCYECMFQSCTSLTTAPSLPATSLVNRCYWYMFSGCSNLTTAPALPATTLADNCYYHMFYGCSNLTTAPALPAETLVGFCYAEMFQNCTNLNYIKAMFTTTPSNTYTQNWVSGVSATGTFVKNSAATWTTTGVNGVPTGWTVETASE